MTKILLILLQQRTGLYLTVCSIIKNSQQYHLSLSMVSWFQTFVYRTFSLIEFFTSFSYRTGSKIKSFHHTENDILAIIKTLDPNKADGCDNISIKMIKICSQSLILPLKIIFEHSLKKDKFPEIWKKAIKKGQNVSENYRTIRLLRIF